MALHQLIVVVQQDGAFVRFHQIDQASLLVNYNVTDVVSILKLGLSNGMRDCCFLDDVFRVRQRARMPAQGVVILLITLFEKQSILLFLLLLMWLLNRLLASDSSSNRLSQQCPKTCDLSSLLFDLLL